MSAKLIDCHANQPNRLHVNKTNRLQAAQLQSRVTVCRLPLGQGFDADVSVWASGRLPKVLRQDDSGRRHPAQPTASLRRLPRQDPQTEADVADDRRCRAGRGSGPLLSRARLESTASPLHAFAISLRRRSSTVGGRRR